MPAHGPEKLLRVAAEKLHQHLAIVSLNVKPALLIDGPRLAELRPHVTQLALCDDTRGPAHRLYTPPQRRRQVHRPDPPIVVLYALLHGRGSPG